MKDYAVLIPTKGRPKALAKLFKACPMLNQSNTYVGVEPAERPLYNNALGSLWERVTKVDVENPDGITGVARHYLQMAAIDGDGGYRRYVLSDDNCRFDDDSLKALLGAQDYTGGVVAGASGTSRFFDSDLIKETGIVFGDGLDVYQKVGMIFWCIPHSWYKTFAYPDDCYFDDIYFILHSMTHGRTDFRVCLQALFTKKRHEAGGTGVGAERVKKIAMSWMRLATDFPQWMDPACLSIRPPYKRIIRAVEEGRKSLNG